MSKYELHTLWVIALFYFIFPYSIIAQPNIPSSFHKELAPIVIEDNQLLAGSRSLLDCQGIFNLQCGLRYVANSANGNNQFDAEDYTNCQSVTSNKPYTGKDLIFKITKGNADAELNIILYNSREDLDIFLFDDCGANQQCLFAS